MALTWPLERGCDLVFLRNVPATHISLKLLTKLTLKVSSLFLVLRNCPQI